MAFVCIKMVNCVASCGGNVGRTAASSSPLWPRVSSSSPFPPSSSFSSSVIDAKMIDQLSFSLPEFACTVRSREKSTLSCLSKILDRRSISNASADFAFQFMTQFLILLLDSRWNRVVSNVSKNRWCSRTGWNIRRMRRLKSRQRTRMQRREADQR